eukprot:TRINITY_DN745_c0_g1_i1.p2 TRINITY_DN745_c0_g1~~TRINITY_DN745_c0_g1_i1.p2  ORF type:complete len:243 (+),score=39.92 TRINITY_DN745_c0_g1_i1:7-735(+)
MEDQAFAVDWREIFKQRTLNLFLPRVKTLIAELQANPKVEKVRCHYGKPVPATTLDRYAEAFTDKQLPPGVREFYSEMDGLKISWVPVGSQPDCQADHGYISIVSIASLFGKAQYARSLSKTTIGGDMFEFDQFVAECSAALARRRRSDPYTVWMCQYSHKLRPTGYHFDEYVSLALQARGFWYWLETLTEENCKMHEAGRFLEMMPSLFDDFDPSVFKPHTRCEPVQSMWHELAADVNLED